MNSKEDKEQPLVISEDQFSHENQCAFPVTQTQRVCLLATALPVSVSIQIEIKPDVSVIFQGQLKGRRAFRHFCLMIDACKTLENYGFMANQQSDRSWKSGRWIDKFAAANNGYDYINTAYTLTVG